MTSHVPYYAREIINPSKFNDKLLLSKRRQRTKAIQMFQVFINKCMRKLELLFRIEVTTYHAVALSSPL